MRAFAVVSIHSGEKKPKLWLLMSLILPLCANNFKTIVFITARSFVSFR
jgi:hypothetical protein